MRSSFAVPSTFNFWRTVYSHGWSSLPPFRVNKESGSVQRAIELSNGEIVSAEISPRFRRKLVIEFQSSNSLPVKYKQEIHNQVKSCFRLDEDFSEFYREARKLSRFRWIPAMGAGRLLRAPTVFEDVVKMLCTTNCSWALTEIMVENLCVKLGRQVGEAEFSFPSPSAIAESSEKFLRKEIRAGYRSPYLLELSKRMVKEELHLEQWRGSSLPTVELFDELRSVKGIGPYAAGNILKLLGRYDYLAIDSWCRKRFFTLHKNGRKTSDKVIERWYEPLGKWRGLFFWLDVTKHWYDQKFPF